MVVIVESGVSKADDRVLHFESPPKPDQETSNDLSTVSNAIHTN